ncbi:MAG: hypothetical protein PVG39_19295 [Desulfobacteraceae bacterium]|jgi:hypothetical protein
MLGNFSFLSLIAFAGCPELQNDSEKESEALVLKSYEVPERLVNEVRQTMDDLLGKGSVETRIGRARIAPDGQLLIAAPKSFHDGVKDFIEHLKNTNPEPSPSADVNYWMVAGRKAKTRAKLDGVERKSNFFSIPKIAFASTFAMVILLAVLLTPGLLKPKKNLFIDLVNKSENPAFIKYGYIKKRDEAVSIPDSAKSHLAVLRVETSNKNVKFYLIESNI